MATMTLWIFFIIFILLMLAIDLLIFHRKPHEVTFKESLIWSIIWITLAFLFNIYVYFAMGKVAALNFTTGYLIEKSLSVDNLFVFLMIFKHFKTPATSQHKVLFWGILGAIVVRALFIFLGLKAIAFFHPLIYLFGLFLIFTGIQFLIGKEKTIDLEKNWLIQIFRRWLPLTHHYDHDQFLIKKENKTFMTPLFLVLIAIETTDILFAIDSVPAILAITFDPFIVFTSNIFAILGLRSLYFLLAKSLNLFTYLHYGISIILIFAGLKMLLSDLWTINPFWSLGFIILILILSFSFGRKKA